MGDAGSAITGVGITGTAGAIGAGGGLNAGAVGVGAGLRSGGVSVMVVWTVANLCLTCLATISLGPWWVIAAAAS